MLFAGAVFPEAPEDFTRDRICIYIIFVLAFKEVIRAVKIAYGCIPLYNILAVNEQMLHIGVKVIAEYIQVTEYMMVVEIVFHSIIGIDPVIGSPFGTRIQDPTIRQESIDISAWKRDLSVFQCFFKKLLHMQVMVNLLKEEIADVLQQGLGCDIA